MQRQDEIATVQMTDNYEARISVHKHSGDEGVSLMARIYENGTFQTCIDDYWHNYTSDVNLWYLLPHVSPPSIEERFESLMGEVWDYVEANRDAAFEIDEAVSTIQSIVGEKENSRPGDA